MYTYIHTYMRCIYKHRLRLCSRSAPFPRVHPAPRSRQFLSSSNNEQERVREELERWQRQYTDVEQLYRALEQERDSSAQLRREKDLLKDDIKVGPAPVAYSCVELGRALTDHSGRVERV